jgi:hypothetical protein
VLAHADDASWRGDLALALRRHPLAAAALRNLAPADQLAPMRHGPALDDGGHKRLLLCTITSALDRDLFVGPAPLPSHN